MAIMLNRKRLQEFLDFRRWNKTDLAKALDFSESYVTLLLSGEREISSNVMEKLTVLTGLSLDELFFCPKMYKNVHQERRVCAQR